MAQRRTQAAMADALEAGTRTLVAWPSHINNTGLWGRPPDARGGLCFANGCFDGIIDAGLDFVRSLHRVCEELSLAVDNSLRCEFRFFRTQCLTRVHVCHLARCWRVGR